MHVSVMPTKAQGSVWREHEESQNSSYDIYTDHLTPKNAAQLVISFVSCDVPWDEKEAEGHEGLDGKPDEE